MNPTSNSIISTITEIFKNMFSSIDNNIYSALDKISFIDTSIINSPYLEKILGSNSSSGILLIANSLLIAFIIYFAIKFLLSNYSIGQPQNPYKFTIKIILVGIFMNASFFLCEQIIYINSLISSAIRDIGNNLLEVNICFSNLIKILDSIISIEQEAQSFFSIDGIIKTIVSISFLNLIFIFSVRYILIKVFVLLSPFAILCTANESTKHLFTSWLKSFISLLLIEIFSSLILIIMFAIEYSPSDVVSKLLFVGSVFALMKVNSYVRDIIGGISLDVQNSMYMLRGLTRFRWFLVCIMLLFET